MPSSSYGTETEKDTSWEDRSDSRSWEMGRIRKRGKEKKRWGAEMRGGGVSLHALSYRLFCLSVWITHLCLWNFMFTLWLTQLRGLPSQLNLVKVGTVLPTLDHCVLKKKSLHSQDQEFNKWKGFNIGTSWHVICGLTVMQHENVHWMIVSDFNKSKRVVASRCRPQTVDRWNKY